MICFTWSRGRLLSKKMRMKAQQRDSASSIKQARLQQEEERKGVQGPAPGGQHGRHTISE